MAPSPLSDLELKPLVKKALEEDLGTAGDITTDAIVPENHKCSAALVSRKAGIAAGLDLARLVFQFCDPDVVFDPLKTDGDPAQPNDRLAIIHGLSRGMLKAERTALNFICHLSGIATETHKLVEAVKPHKARISCTRKTNPGLRLIEKYAVRAGGGVNHRFGLYDMVLIKDNHVAIAGGVRPAVLAARASVGSAMKIELEVDSLEQLKEALDLPLDAVLLDNMTPAQLKQAVIMVNGRFVTEASGGVIRANVQAIAATGVDVISAGWITHSAPILDIGLDLPAEK